MCLEPYKVKDAKDRWQTVACKGCRVCRDNRVNDLVGRCIAEQSTASKTYAVTLTYKGDTAGSAVLRYKDVQLFLKSLRNERGGNYSVRYICAGEYGTKKGRTHWHIILFFYGRYPAMALDKRIEWKHWPHGFVYFQQPDYGGFRYVLKYALKQDAAQGAVKALTMSKKPPLGHSYFMQLAQDYVRQRLALHSPEYSFRHVRDREGKPRKYWLQGRMKEMFAAEYCRLWGEQVGGEPPYTDWLYEKHLDPIARKEMEQERDRAIFQGAVQTEREHASEAKEGP